MSVTTYTYLEDVIQDRLVPMLKEVGAVFTPPILQVTDYAELRLSPPYWWVYVPPQVIAPEKFGASQWRVDYQVITRGVVALTTAGFDGQYSRMLYRLLPTVLHYFHERNRLVYAGGQSVLDYLQHAAVTTLTGFGIFNDGSNHIGLELQHTLTFTLSLTPAPGNA